MATGCEHFRLLSGGDSTDWIWPFKRSFDLHIKSVVLVNLPQDLAYSSIARSVGAMVNVNIKSFLTYVGQLTGTHLNGRRDHDGREGTGGKS